jgi:tetratricopeptide (TPR) repeat protein
LADEGRRVTEYERLQRFLLWHQGKFALGLVRVNHPRQRDGIVASLQEELDREGVTLLVRNFSQHQVRSLKEELRRDEELGEHLARDSQRVALALVGLEPSVETDLQPEDKIPTFVASLNLERDAISLGYPVPLTLWLTDYAMDRLAEAAVDFWDFKSGVFVFHFVPAEAPMPREEITRLEEAGGKLSPELLQERLDILEDRISEMRRRGPLELAEKERLAELLEAMGETYLASEDAKVKTQGIPYLGEARRLYGELGKHREEAEALARIAEAYYWADQNRLAKERYQEALPIFREIGHRLGEADTIQALGDIHRALAEYQEARSRYQEALSIYGEIGNRLGEANTIRSLGDVHRILAEYEEARSRYQEALSIYGEIGNRLGEANTIRALGDVHRILAEYEEARRRYQEALSIYGEIGNRLGEANTIRALGDVHTLLAEYQEARSRYQEALPIFQEIGDRLGEANTIQALGGVHMRLAEYEEARRRYQEALPIFQEIGDRLGKAHTIQALGDLHRSQREYALAMARYEEAMVTCHDIGDRYRIAGTFWRMGLTWAEQEEIQQAIEAFQKAGTIFGEIGVRYWEERCREVLAAFEEAER